MEIQLSHGAIARMINDRNVRPPTLQILFLQPSPTASIETYRLKVSDGLNYWFAVVRGSSIEGGMLETFGFVRIDDWERKYCSKGELYIFVVYKLTVLPSGTNVGSVMGNPSKVTVPPKESVASEPGVSIDDNRNNHVQMVRAVPKFTFRRRRPPALNVETLPTSIPRATSIVEITSTSFVGSIMGRVTCKTDIKQSLYGNLFSVNVQDATGTIQVTAYDAAVNMFYEEIVAGEVYFIKAEQAQLESNEYNPSGHRFKLILRGSSEVWKCSSDESMNVPLLQFVTTGQVASVPEGNFINIVGLIKSQSPITFFKSKKDGSYVSKKQLYLVDELNVKLSLTLFGLAATDADYKDESIISVIYAKVSDFDGKSLNYVSGSQIIVNPILDRANEIGNWHNQRGFLQDSMTMTQSLIQVAPYLRLMEVENAGNVPYFRNQCTLVHVECEDAFFRMCTGSNCFEKLQECEGLFWCNKCGRLSGDCELKMSFELLLADASGDRIVTCFHDQAMELFNESVQDMMLLYEDDELEDVCMSYCNRTYFTTIRVEKKNQELCLSVVTIEPLTYYGNDEDILQEPMVE